MRALGRVAIEHFEARLIEHVMRCFPARARALGLLGVRLQVRHQVERALGHGLVAQRDVCRYVNVAFALGRAFDTDPSLPWAAKILGDRGLSGEERASRLVATAVRHLSGAHSPPSVTPREMPE
jgi:hypothetical protein